MSIAPTFVDSGLTGASAFAEAENAIAVAQAQVYSPEFGVASGILALTLFVRASILAGRSDAIAEEAEPVWARVELFGHSVRYGEVVEVEFAGRRFVEIVEPPMVALVEADGELVEHGVSEERRKRYHPNAIYAFEELPEEQVRAALYSTHGLFKHEDGSWRERPSRTRDDDDEGDLF